MLITSCVKSAFFSAWYHGVTLHISVFSVYDNVLACASQHVCAPSSWPSWVRDGGLIVCAPDGTTVLSKVSCVPQQPGPFAGAQERGLRSVVTEVMTVLRMVYVIKIR